MRWPTDLPGQQWRAATPVYQPCQKIDIKQISEHVLPHVRVQEKGWAMSDNYINDDFSDDDLDQPEQQNDIKSLRRAANQKKKLEAELESMRRELAFAKAGLPLDDPRMRYFVKGYEGEMTAESIREAALEAGFLASQKQEQAPDPQMQAAAAAQQRVMQASAGATTPDSSESSALAALEEAMREGGVEGLLEVARQYGIPPSYHT